MIDWSQQYIETNPAERAQFLWVSVFYYMTSQVIDDYGQAGENCIRQAVRNFGHERGIRRRQRSDALGLEPNLVNMFAMKDILSDPRFAAQADPTKPKINVSEPEHNFMTCNNCPNADMWAVLEGKKPGDYLNIGSIYCEEVHHHLYGDYDPAIQMNLTDILTKGDQCCNFRLHMRKANMKPFSAGPYVPQSWEDFGDCVESSIYGMFCLHFYHYANAVYEAYGEGELRKILHAWGMERGARLKELNRRNGKENTADVLLLEGDLFLDPREDKEILCATAQKACVEVKRSILCQLLHDHQADYLAPLYFQHVTQGICDAYAPGMRATVENLTTEGKGGYRLTLEMA